MYEQPLLCGIMNDWYGRSEALQEEALHGNPFRKE